MNCERSQDQFELFAAGELPAETAAELEGHAAECPACAARIEAARRRLAALDEALASVRAADGFVERTMARVRREPERPDQPLIPQITHPVLRYAAMAAAAALFVLAGYGFLRRAPLARFEGYAPIGRAASLVPGRLERVGAKPATQGSALSYGDVVATPRDTGNKLAVMRLAGGRLVAAMKPASVVRIADPRSGTVAHLARGGLVMRALGKHAGPAVTTPLARVAAVGGAVSVQVLPKPATGEPSGSFRGLVTLRAHDGWARVQLASRRGETVTLRPGQTLILRSEGRPPTGAEPLPHDEIRRRLTAQREAVAQRLAHFRRQWEDVSGMVRYAPPEELPRLFVDGVRFQQQINRHEVVAREIDRRLELLSRIEEDPQILQALHRER